MIVHNPYDINYKGCGCNVRHGKPISIYAYVERGYACMAPELIICEENQNPTTFPLVWEERDGIYDIYSVQLSLKVGLFWYAFSLQINGQMLYCNHGVDGSYMKDTIVAPFQLTVYDRDYAAPQWLMGRCMYHIFVDRFHRLGELPNEIESGKWIHQSTNEPVWYLPDDNGEILNNDFYGGNLLGIMEKLPYLQSLGVDVIYLSPIFKAYSNHRYDTGDYHSIDPLLGSEQDFSDLCTKAKEMQISIILDGVFSHTGSDSIYFNQNKHYDSVGAALSPQSPYYAWYSFTDYPDQYECWWGIKTLPCVSKMQPTYLEYMLTGKEAVVKKWLTLGADGWRLDVADELPDEFIAILRTSARSTKKEAAIIGEVWEDASNKVSYGKRRQYLLGNALDGVMNYPFRECVIAWIMGNAQSGEFNRRMQLLYANYPQEMFLCCMNFLGTHDTPRAATIFGGQNPKDMSREQQAQLKLSENQRELAKNRMKIALGIMYTFPGVPCIFYGDEILLEGAFDPFNRAPYPWDGRNKEVSDLVAKLAALRKSKPALLLGTYLPIDTEEGILAYKRIYENKMVLFVANREVAAQTIQIESTKSCINALTGCTISPDALSQLLIEPYEFVVLEWNYD